MTGKALGRAAQALNTLIESGGCVDRLDTERVWGEGVDEEDDLDGNSMSIRPIFEKPECVAVCTLVVLLGSRLHWLGMDVVSIRSNQDVLVSFERRHRERARQIRR